MQANQNLPPNAVDRRSFNYGWVILAACSLMVFITYGLAYSYSVFFKPLAGYFHWDRAAVSMIYSLAIIIRGAAAIGSGWLADRYGARKIMIFCGLMMAAGYLLSSRVTALWQFFLTYAVVEAIGMSGIFGIGTTLVTRWFTRHRGLALGIVASGSGLGTLLLVPASERLISTADWSQAFVIIGIAAGVLMFAASALLKTPPAPAVTEKNASHLSGATLGQALRDSRLWLTMAAFLFFFYGTQTVMVHLVNYATDAGIDPLLAATFVSVIGAISIAGRLSTGVIAEKIGLYRSLILMGFLMVVSFIVLLFTRSSWAFYLFAVLFGIPYGGEVTQIPMVIARFFGTRVMATLMGVTVFIIGLGGALGPWLAGKIYDMTDSYNGAFIAGACAAFGSIIMVGLLQRQDKSKSQA